MSALTLDEAAFITTGYQRAKCRGCPSMYWKAPWFIPGGNYCEACRDSVIEHFREESREREQDNDIDDTAND